MGKSSRLRAEANAGKASMPVKKAAIDDTSTAIDKGSGTNAFTYPIVIIIIIVVAYVWQSRGTLEMKNLSNVEIDILKEHIFGDTPHLFYCDRRSNSGKKAFVDLHSEYKGKIGFATVNCSQVLPSGVTLWEKFKLKREWRPAVFATAPWMRLKQVPVHVVNNKVNLRRFIDQGMRPQAKFVANTADFVKNCGFSSGNSSTCMVVSCSI